MNKEDRKDEKWRLFPKKTQEEVDRDPVYREVSRQLKTLRDLTLPDTDEDRKDLVERLRKIADASRREDGSDIPLGSEVRAAAAELDRLCRELEEARKAIAWANNSLFGSHGFFLSMNGGEPDEHHLDRAIENLKEQNRKYYAELEEARKAQEPTPYAEITEPYRAALRMIREAIETLFGPAANLESEEAELLRGPEPHHTAEAVIAALQNVAGGRDALIEAAEAGWNACRRQVYLLSEDYIERNHELKASDTVEGNFYRGQYDVAKSFAKAFSAFEARDCDYFKQIDFAALSATKQDSTP